jgi:centractin
MVMKMIIITYSIIIVRVYTSMYPAIHIYMSRRLSIGVHDCLVHAILRSDMDLRKTLFSQIVLSGGSTLFPGFGDRLLYEIRKKAPRDIKIRISAPPQRQYSTWIGGSILASLATFKTMWITKAEYEEHGAAMVHRKTL